MSKFNQKGFVHILSLFVLLAGIVAGLYLVQHPQIFKPKAYSEQVSPLLQAERISELRTKFKIDEQIGDDKVEGIVKDDLFQKGIMVDGELINGEVTVSVLGDCINEDTNYQLSEIGVYPPPLFR